MNGPSLQITMLYKTLIFFGFLIASLPLAIHPLHAQGTPASAGDFFVVNLPHLYLDSDADLLITVTGHTAGYVSIIENERGDSTTMYVPLDSAWHFRISRAAIGYPLQEEGRSPRSVRIRATGLVTVQGAYDGDYVTDSWIVPPVRDLGRSHRILSLWNNSPSGGVLTVVATEPETLVRITPSVPTPRGSPGFSYGVTLDEGEVWQVVPTIPEFTDFSGTRVDADKPVYVLAGHAGSQLFGRGANNPTIEWVPPTNYWGTRFVSQSLPRRPEGLYKILADEESTILFVNNVPVDTLSAGETRWWIDPFPLLISASHHILVAQFVDHRDTSIVTQDGDPAMTIFQPQRAWSRDYLWQTIDLPTRITLQQGSDERLRWDNYLMIAADFAEGSFVVELDGRDVSSFLTSRIAGTGYAVGWIPATKETHRIRADGPVSAQVHGINTFDAYAHPVGYPIPPLLDLPDFRDTVCQPEYEGILVLWNRSDERVTISQVMTGGRVTIDLAPGATLQPGERRNVAISLALPFLGPHVDTVFVTATAERTGRSNTIPSVISLLRLPLSLTVSPSSLEFRTATPATPDLRRALTITNDGALPIEISNLPLTPPFRLISPLLPVTLSPGDSLVATLSYAPDSYPSRDSSEAFLQTAPCMVERTVLLTGRSDVERTPSIRSDTLWSYCSDTIEQEFTISNGTQYQVEIDSLGYPRSLEVLRGISGLRLLSGESITGLVRWNNLTPGWNRVVMPVYINGLEVPEQLTLLVYRATPALSVSPTLVDLGRLRRCVDPDPQISLLVENSGDVPLPGVQALSLNGVVTSTPSVGIDLPVGGSSTIRLEFSDGLTGEVLDTIIVESPYCEERDTVIVRAEFVAPDVHLIPIVDSVEGILSCTFPQSFRFRFENRGTVADTVQEIRLPNASYALRTTLPQVLLPGESMEIEVAVVPSQIGVQFDTAFADVSGCNRIIPLGLTTSTLLQAWRAESNDLLLRNLLPYTESVASFDLQNLGEVGATIERVYLESAVPGLSVDVPPLPQVLTPGESGVITVRYLSPQPTSFSTNLVVVGGACLDTLTIPVVGQPGDIELSVSVGSAGSEIDEIVRLPIVLTSNLRTSDTVDVGFSLEWLDRGLYLEGITPRAPFRLDLMQQSVNSQVRVIDLRFVGVPGTIDTIGTVDVRLLLSDREAWEIVLDGDATAGNVDGVRYRLEYYGDTVQISELCRIDGTRLIRLREGLYLLDIIPHPIEGDGTVRIYSGFQEIVSASFEIIDILGNRLLDRTILLIPGENSLQIDLSSFPAGQYRVLFKANGMVLQEDLIKN